MVGRRGQRASRDREYETRMVLSRTSLMGPTRPSSSYEGPQVEQVTQDLGRRNVASQPARRSETM